MRLLRKINKGFVLTIIVLILLISYIVSLEVQRNKEKESIREACEKYLAFENQYTLLPKEYQSFKNKIPEEKLKEYEEKVSEELKKLMIQDEKIYNLQKNIIEDKLSAQLEETNILYTSKTSKLVKISKYEFEDNQVTVTIEDSIQVEFIKKDEQAEEETVKNKTSKIEDTITLKRENDGWKVVFAEVGIIPDMYQYYM